VASLFHGRGIVISGGGYQLHLVYASLRLLRELGCLLPVDIWVSSGRNETVPVAMLHMLRGLDAQVYDTDAVAATFPEMLRQMHPTSRHTKPYILKQIALISARCRECLLLDADSLPVRDPTYLFTAKLYQETGHLLWPDYWHMRGGPASVREIFGLPQAGSLRDERTVESGQMVVDKERAWRTLLVSVYMQVQTEFYDNQMRALSHLGGGGDKQTFLIGCLATNSSCHLLQHPVASAGVLLQGAFCGRTMVQVSWQAGFCTSRTPASPPTAGQHDPDGNVLFVHSNMDKERYHRAVLAASAW
jgi:alpha 1,2-mannosyltransferase